VGKWHDFPTTPEEIAQTFREIGVDGMEYEEFFITDYDVGIDGLSDHLGEYTGVDELNYLASLLDEMKDYELTAYQAILEAGEYSGNIQNLINLTGNLDSFGYMPSVNDDYDLGYYWLEESGCYGLEGMGNLSMYIDYERFGADLSINEGGTFTSRGYVYAQDSVQEFYDGMDVPEEYRVLSMEDGPEMTMTMGGC